MYEEQRLLNIKALDGDKTLVADDHFCQGENDIDRGIDLTINHIKIYFIHFSKTIWVDGTKTHTLACLSFCEKNDIPLTEKLTITRSLRLLRLSVLFLLTYSTININIRKI